MSSEAPADIRNRTDRELICSVMYGDWNLAKEFAERLETALNRIEMLERELAGIQPDLFD